MVQFQQQIGQGEGGLQEEAGWKNEEEVDQGG